MDSPRLSTLSRLRAGRRTAQGRPAGDDCHEALRGVAVPEHRAGYVSLCPELDIASQGDTIEEARENLQEAVELFFETASESELQTRLHEEVYVTRVEVSVG
jgi:predicted RNase H-like HicB family nuclease